MTVAIPQRFKRGEAFLYISNEATSLPVCSKEEGRRYIRHHHDSARWTALGRPLFCQIEANKPCFGYVCDYDEMCLLTYAGSEWSESEQHALFGMIFVDASPQLVRIEDNDPRLWKLVDAQNEVFKNAAGVLLALNQV